MVRYRPQRREADVEPAPAEETLNDARARLKSELPARPEMLAGLGVSVLAKNFRRRQHLGFARRPIHEATQNYNDALHQFPTWVVAGLFQFHGAGTL